MARATGSRHAGAFEGIDPATGKRIDIFFTHRRVERVKSRGPWAVMELAVVVREMLSHPTTIFEGIRWNKDDDVGVDGWRCYSGCPSCSFRPNPDGTAREAQPYENQVFIVFVNDEMVAYNWRWEKEAPDLPGAPEDWDTRFGKRVL